VPKLASIFIKKIDVFLQTDFGLFKAKFLWTKKTHVVCTTEGKKTAVFFGQKNTNPGACMAPTPPFTMPQRQSPWSESPEIPIARSDVPGVSLLSLCR